MLVTQFMIFIPFIFSILVPFLYRVFNPRIHTGWFVFLIPVIIFLYLCQYIPNVSNREPFIILFHGSRLRYSSYVRS